MIPFRRTLLPAILLVFFAMAWPVLANDVTVNGTVNFSALDGSADDADHTVNGVFTVSGNLVINGTVLCIDDSGRDSGCAMSFNVGHDLVINAGGGVFSENRIGTGSGGAITFTVGNDFVMHGPTSSLAGAIVSSDSTSSSGSHGGDITANVAGAVTIDSGATIDSGSANDVAGAIAITAGGHIDASGNVLAGPSRTILSTRLTGDALSGGTGNQVGGVITIKSTSFIQPGINVGPNANVVSQGQATSAGPVTLEGCGIIVDGLVAALGHGDTHARVALRSGKTIQVDGRDLGVANATLGRNGKIRGDAAKGTAGNHAIDLFAFGDISVLGPDPASSSQFAITGTTADAKSSGAHVDVISLTGSVTASGNVADVSGSASGDAGGSVSVSSQGDVNFDHAILSAAGDSATNNSNRAGGSIALRSYSGNVVWTNGSGDVRPTGSGSGLPASAQGTIALTACGTISISGSTFPSNGSPVGVFPTESNACTPAAPALPTGEPPLPVCCNVITITNPSVTSGTAGQAFNQTFTQTGAIGTATFSLSSGTLPTGLTLSSSGVLSGTPTVVGNFPIVVEVVDSQGCTGIGTTYNLTINCQTITVTNPSVTTTVAASPFSATFTQSGAIGGATFSTTSPLPTGLTLSSNGVLAGTPTVVGPFTITVTATDANGCTGSSSYTLTITCQPITVTNPATNSGVANSPFSATFTQSGAIGTATFSESGALPTGVTLAANGTLSGTPLQVGSFPIVVTATDANGCTGTSSYTLTIACQVITVTNPAANSGTVNIPFSATFSASNTIGTTTFAESGALPAGITLASNGTLSGTPTQTGSFPIVVTATDANGCSGSGATYTLTIACQVITVNVPANNTATAGSPFSAAFTASNTIGTTTFTTASALPAGIALASNGTLSGTPTVIGTFPIVVTATDANGCSGTSATYTLTVVCQVITVTPPSVNTGVAGSPFSVAFSQSGALGSATFSIVSGSLPAGLSFSAGGVLSGTPLQTGNFGITVKVTDVNGCSGTTNYAFTIVCPVITVTNPSVSTSVAGAAFSQTFTQSGAVGSATFSTAITLPAGLTLSPTGVLSGTPTQTGTFPIVVTVTDSNGCTGTGATYNLTITCQTITVTAPALNVGTAGTPFSAAFTQSGAIGGATFSIASGTLPSGVTLAADGTLSGTPLQVGAFTITVTVTDGNGCTGTSSSYTLTIACQTIIVTHPPTMSGTVGTAFSQQYTQSGGIGTVTFALTAGTLPTGMTLASDGTLSGTPMQSGTFTITVTATDANGCSGSDTTSLTIACQTITVTNPATTTGTVGTPFSATFTQSGGIGTTTFSLASGTLPSGLTLGTNGTLSGTPMQPGTFTITVTATDGNGCSGTSSTYSLSIACQTITVTNPAVTSGTVNAPFSATFTQSGGIGAVTFSIASGTLPTGLSLASNGVLSGTPMQPGTFTITVIASDANRCSGTSAAYTLTIACQTITVTNPAVTTGTVDALFNQTFTESGAVGIANFSLASGVLPAGMSLSTTGILSGTPQVPGTFPITVTVTDANGCTGTGTTYNLVIACQTITVTNPATTTGSYNTPFSAAFTQSGVGTHGPAVFTLAGGTLPAGLSLATSGVLSGTPTQTGVFTFTVKVTDANGCSGTGASYTLTIAPKIVAKTYTDVANTQLAAGVTAPPTPTVTAIALSSGDQSDNPITYTVTTPPSQGTLTTFNSNGTFLYTPNAGNQVPDSFAYTATSNGVTVNATAAIGFSGRVWYVDNATASGTNDGRSNTPFKTMTAVGAAGTAANDYIYVSKGSSTTTGSYAMVAGQKLIGAGATLSVGGVLTVTGSSANTPTLGGTITLASNVTVAGIDMSTGSATAMTGTSVSGVSVTARNVTTTTGAAVVIGGSGNAGTLAFTSINSGTTTAGPTNAISLANFNGAFSVTGDGSNAANGSGGTIQKTTGNAVNLATATGVSLSSMVIKNSAVNGVGGTSVSNIAFLGCQIQNNGTSTATDSGVNLYDTAGTVTFTNTSVTGSKSHNVQLNSTSLSTAAITSLSITGGSFSSSVSGGGILIAMNHSASIASGTISGATFSGNSSFGLDVVTNDNGVVGDSSGSLPSGAVTVTGCTFTNNGLGASFANGGGSGAANMYVRFVGNTLTGTSSHVVNVVSGALATGGTQKVRIDGNTIGNALNAGSGSAFGEGIVVTQQGKVTQRVTIVNNTIRQVPFGRGIDVQALGPVTAGGTPSTYPTDAFIVNNDVNPQDTSGFPLYAIYAAADDQGSPTLVHAEIHGNTVPTTDACDTQCGPGTGMIFYEVVTAPSTGTLFNFGGNATVSSEIANTNTGTSGKTTSTNAGLSLTSTATQTVP